MLRQVFDIKQYNFQDHCGNKGICSGNAYTSISSTRPSLCSWECSESMLLCFPVFLG